MSTTPATKPSSSSRRRDKDDTNNPDIHLPGIGNYVFQKTVGEGNFAKVKLAKHKITGVEVAIKVIDKTTLDEKKLSKLYREVKIMKLLHHPHIVKLYEVIETKHTVFLVMEYASGGELYDYLVVHGKMKEKEARAKFRQILSAVSYCHKKRVIHRDLKAENLLLDSNLDIKIADFGFSNYFDPDAKLDTFCGSPPYAAPELFQGRRYTGPEVDIWSLGVILYVLTTGCLPFDGKNLQEMRESVCRGKYRIPFYLSDSCEKLLRKFLIRDPYKRASLDMLIDDPWINESFGDSPINGELAMAGGSGPVVEDERLVKIMETKYHIDREAILKSLRENLYDDVAAIYYLLYYEKDARGRVASELKELGASVDATGAAAAASGHANAAATAAPATAAATGTAAAGASSTGPAPPSAVSAPPKTAPSSSEHEKTIGGIPIKTVPLASGDNTSHPPAAHKASEEPAMSKIEEDGPGDAVPALGARPVVKTKPRKRRFTVGGEADVAKYADEDQEAAEGLKKMQAPQVLPEEPIRTSTTGAGATPIPRPITAAPVMTHGVGSLQPPTSSQETGAGSLDEQPKIGNPGDVTGQDGPDDGSGGQNGACADDRTQRKRHNTIVGILRNSIRKSSDAPSSPTISAISPSKDSGAADVIPSANQSSNGVNDSGSLSPIKPGEDNKPRSLRFTFNSNTTSTKPPDDIIQQVAAACTSHGITHRLTSRFLIECSWAGTAGPNKEQVKFEIEVCKLPRLKNLHGLRFKRVGGSSSDYKDICEKILQALQL